MSHYRPIDLFYANFESGPLFSLFSDYPRSPSLIFFDSVPVNARAWEKLDNSDCHRDMWPFSILSPISNDDLFADLKRKKKHKEKIHPLPNRFNNKANPCRTTLLQPNYTSAVLSLSLS